MVTGRRLIERALRAPTQAAGWTPAADPHLLIEEVRATRHGCSCTGPCTLAVVLALEGRPDDGWAFVQERLAMLGSSTTAFAEDMRGMSARLRAWPDRPVQ